MKYTWQKTNVGAVDYLGAQIQRMARNLNESHIETRRRYLSATERFVKYTGVQFKLKKFSNLQDKHLASYVKHLKDKGSSHKYIKNELAAIRYMHNKIDNPKYTLKDSKSFNKEMELSSTKDGRVDRAWSDKEIERFRARSEELNRLDIKDIFEGVRTTGLRLDEICTLRKEDLKDALKTGMLTPRNTKGGTPREVPISKEARALYEQKVSELNKGEYAFTPKEFVVSHRIHEYKKTSTEVFIQS